MAESDQILEIYRLHAELADRVSQRRERANRLFVILLVGLLVFLAAMLRSGAGDLSGVTDQIRTFAALRGVRSVDLGANVLMVFFGVVGVLLSAAWFALIRSYRQLNTSKFQALHELEKNLPYRFFAREWELLREGRDYRRYWRLTVVETSLPILFGLLFLGVLVFAFVR